MIRERGYSRKMELAGLKDREAVYKEQVRPDAASRLGRYRWHASAPGFLFYLQVSSRQSHLLRSFNQSPPANALLPYNALAPPSTLMSNRRKDFWRNSGWVCWIRRSLWVSTVIRCLCVEFNNSCDHTSYTHWKPIGHRIWDTELQCQPSVLYKQ